MNCVLVDQEFLQVAMTLCMFHEPEYSHTVIHVIVFKRVVYRVTILSHVTGVVQLRSFVNGASSML